MALFFVSEMNGARVLKIGNASLFDGHLPFAAHREIGLTEHAIAFQRIGGRFFSSGIARDNGLGFEIVNDEAEDVLCVIDTISAHRADGHREALFCFSQ